MTKSDTNLPAWPAATLAAFSAALAVVLPSHGTVLDLGPTGEQIAGYLQEQGLQVVDINLAAPKGSTTRPKPQYISEADNSFDSAYTVYGFQRIIDWPHFIKDIRRVLHPDGLLIHGTTEEVATDVTNHMEVGWETILRRNEVNLKARSEPRSYATLEATLRSSGAESQTFAVCRWSENYTPRRRLEIITTRYTAKTLNVPLPVFVRCVKDYERWLKAQYSDLDTSIEVTRECAIHLWRFVN
jgi:hypothetical protein